MAGRWGLAGLLLAGSVAGHAQLVINEIDYDQPGTDAAEFIELAHTGSTPVDLAGWRLELINGANGGAAVYNTLDLSAAGTLAGGDYLVVCGNSATVDDCDLDVTPDTNLVQNGAPDAVALRDGEGALIDRVSYEGDVPGVTEGTGVTPGDNNTDNVRSLSRFPDGSDTDQNNTDFSLRCATPGAANGAATEGCGVIVPPFGTCGAPATLISAVQGSGAASPLVDTVVTVEAVVVGDFQGSDALGGFFLQEDDDQVDADPATSEGLFVFNDDTDTAVTAGQRVRVQGRVEEAFGLTRLAEVTNTAVCGTGTVTTAAVTLPQTALDDVEAFEGMRVRFDQTLTVTDPFNLGRFGELTVSSGGRLFNPTHLTAPGETANVLQAANDRRQLLIDDGSGREWPTPIPYLGDDNTRRLGDTVTGLTGILSFGFSRYRLQPTTPPVFTRVNARPARPAVLNAGLTVASFNVLNYFTTLDTGVPACGPDGDLDCRGANTAIERIRQRDKLLAALLSLEADIVGLVELENNPTAAIQDLVDGLNTALGDGSYAFIDTGTLGSDAITVGLIYRPATVTPQGDHQILDASVDANFNDDKNRPVLAQTFSANTTGDRFTVAINHLKSKGSPCDDVGDPDAGDGQGNCNGVRTAAAQAPADWLATDPTGSGSDARLILGDLNAYAREDPIATLEAAGYTDLIERFIGPNAYSFVFFGQAGYLDHALASPALLPYVTGVTEWPINADEPRALDYNDAIEDPGESSGNTPLNPPELYRPDAFRSSDHDPVIVGLDFSGTIFIDQFEAPSDTPPD